jgi:hypothetical protein
MLDADRLAVDAVHRALVSAIKVPNNREKYRELLEVRHSAAIFMLHKRVNSMVYSQIPCACEQGISRRISGTFCTSNGKKQGISHWKKFMPQL